MPPSMGRHTINGSAYWEAHPFGRDSHVLSEPALRNIDMLISSMYCEVTLTLAIPLIILFSMYFVL